MRLLKWLPSRRVELLFTLLVVAACFWAASFFESQHDLTVTALVMTITLEIVLPLGMGLMAAGLMANDPALDIVLSAYRPAWQALVERLLFIGGTGVLLGSAGLSLAALWDLPLSKEGSAQIYIWLSPMLFYLGVSSAVSLLRGRMLDGTLTTLGIMGLSLMLLVQIPLLCNGNAPGEPCIWWLASPIMTLGSPADVYWPVNRLLWLGLGAVLIYLSLRLTRREEPLLHEVSRE